MLTISYVIELVVDNLQDMCDVYRYGANPPVPIKDEDELILAADIHNSNSSDRAE